MISKDYLIPAWKNANDSGEIQAQDTRSEILNILHTAFRDGAIVEVKIVEGVDLNSAGKRFSKLRLDIISNTDFDSFSN